ncbi:hypothetical protein VCV18_000260 [Metarhizium anisopliae]
MPAETNSLSRSDTNLRASPHAVVSPMSQPAPRAPGPGRPACAEKNGSWPDFRWIIIPRVGRVNPSFALADGMIHFQRRPRPNFTSSQGAY